MRAVSDCHLLVAGRSQISRWLVLLARPYPLVAIPPVVCAVHCCTYSTRQRENGSGLCSIASPFRSVSFRFRNFIPALQFAFSARDYPARGKRNAECVCVRGTHTRAYKINLKCVNAHTRNYFKTDLYKLVTRQNDRILFTKTGWGAGSFTYYEKNLDPAPPAIGANIRMSNYF